MLCEINIGVWPFYGHSGAPFAGREKPGNVQCRTFFSPPSAPAADQSQRRILAVGLSPADWILFYKVKQCTTFSWHIFSFVLGKQHVNCEYLTTCRRCWSRYRGLIPSCQPGLCRRLGPATWSALVGRCKVCFNDKLHLDWFLFSLGFVVWELNNDLSNTSWNCWWCPCLMTPDDRNPEAALTGGYEVRFNPIFYRGFFLYFYVFSWIIK